MSLRYALCRPDCTTDCGACKGSPPQVVPLHALLVGDKVVDASGTHRITEVWATGKRYVQVWIVRDDRPRYPEPLGFDDETITIIPSFAARAELTQTQEA